MSRKKVEKNISYDDQRKIYYVTLYYGTGENGKPIKNTVTSSSKKDAQKILRDHNKKMQAGTTVLPSRDSLSEVTKAYIDYKATSLAITTIHGYTSIYKNHIAPYFEKKQIQDITAKDIQDYISCKAAAGLSMNSVKKHIALLYSVFQNAYTTGIVNENPLTRMERVRVSKPKIQCMNAEEIRELCESVKGTTLEVPVMLAAYLGLRRGEVAGLKWENIDFESSTLRIENTRTKAGGTIVEKAPKTERSIRQLELPCVLTETLQAHKIRQAKIMHAHGQKHDYVVTGRSGAPISPNYISENFHKHIKAHGFKDIHFHGLRHSFASIANEAGTSMSDISSAMGHSSIAVTGSIYTHEFSKTKAKAVNAVAQSIGGAKQEQSATK